jgi:hypothetical protein
LLASFNDAQEDGSKERLIAQTLAEMAVHGALEQELIIPALRDALRDELLEDWAARDYRDLTQIMEQVSAASSLSERLAKFASFAETARRHLAAEQEKLLSRLNLADLPDLGELLAKRREELERVRLFL